MKVKITKAKMKELVEQATALDAPAAAAAAGPSLTPAVGTIRPSSARTPRWDNAQAYSSPGAPPNGADYVRLRDGSGAYLGASQVRSLSFSGQQAYAPDPLEWKVVGGALSADLTEDLANRTLARQVTVPAASPTLTFKAKYDLQEQWDSGSCRSLLTAVRRTRRSRAPTRAATTSRTRIRSCWRTSPVTPACRTLSRRRRATCRLTPARPSSCCSVP